jgi:RNA polymerase sigma-70 factor (ECF subfamily)
VKDARQKTEMMQLQLNSQNFDPIRKGDRKAFEQVFRAYYAALVRFALEILKDQDAAEDRVQEVFVKLWERREKIEIQTSLKAYLYMAVKNHCLNKLKTEARTQWMDDEQESEIHSGLAATDARVQTKLMASHIDQAIEMLPPRCALIFKMSRFEEKSYKEIAEALDLSVKTVEHQMGKALFLLRKYLAPYLQIWLTAFLADFFS